MIRSELSRQLQLLSSSSSSPSSFLPQPAAAALSSSQSSAAALLRGFGLAAVVERMEELQSDVLSRLLSQLVLELNAEEAAAAAATEARRSAATLRQSHELLSKYEAEERCIRQRWLTTARPDDQQLQHTERQPATEAEAHEQRLQHESAASPFSAQHATRPSGLSLQPLALSSASSASEPPTQLPPPPPRHLSEQEAATVSGWCDVWLQAAVGEAAAELWSCLDGVVDGLVEAELGAGAEAAQAAG